MKVEIYTAAFSVIFFSDIAVDFKMDAWRDNWAEEHEAPYLHESDT